MKENGFRKGKSKQQVVQETFSEEQIAIMKKIKKAQQLQTENQTAYDFFIASDELVMAHNKILTETKDIVGGLIENYEAYTKHAANIIANKTSEEGDTVPQQVAANLKIQARMEKALLLVKSNLAALYPYTSYKRLDGKTPVTTVEEWEKLVEELNEKIKTHTTYVLV